MALSIKFDVDPATRKAMEKLNPKTVDLALIEGGRDFQTFALRILPKLTFQRIKNRTGTLAKSWRLEQPKPTEINVTNIAASSGAKRTPYAKFIEFGTRPHKVRISSKKVLVWNLQGRPLSAFSVGAIKSNRGNFGFSKGHNVSGIKARNIFGGFWPGGAKKLSQFIGEALGRVLGTS